jgi:hypothetical protein
MSGMEYAFVLRVWECGKDKAARKEKRHSHKTQNAERENLVEAGKWSRGNWSPRNPKII